jgi:hypothetical protein
MNAHEIEATLAREGLAPYNMEQRSMTEGQSVRMGEDGEYDIADYLESDNSPEAQAITEELLAMGREFLADEFGIKEKEEDDEPVDDEPVTTTAWDFLTK